MSPVPLLSLLVPPRLLVPCCFSVTGLHMLLLLLEPQVLGATEIQETYYCCGHQGLGCIPCYWEGQGQSHHCHGAWVYLSCGCCVVPGTSGPEHCYVCCNLRLRDHYCWVLGSWVQPSLLEGPQWQLLQWWEHAWVTGAASIPGASGHGVSMRNSFAVPQEAKRTITILLSNSTSRCTLFFNWVVYLFVEL